MLWIRLATSGIGGGESDKHALRLRLGAARARCTKPGAPLGPPRAGRAAVKADEPFDQANLFYRTREVKGVIDSSRRDKADCST